MQQNPQWLSGWLYDQWAQCPPQQHTGPVPLHLQWQNNQCAQVPPQQHRGPVPFHPQWQNNQCAQVPPQRHRGPVPLMQINFGGYDPFYHPYQGQADYNVNHNHQRQVHYKSNPGCAPGKGFGRRQVPYEPNPQKNRINGTPPNIRRSDVQRKISSTKPNNKSSSGSKINSPLNTGTTGKLNFSKTGRNGVQGEIPNTEPNVKSPSSIRKLTPINTVTKYKKKENYTAEEKYLEHMPGITKKSKNKSSYVPGAKPKNICSAKSEENDSDDIIFISHSYKLQNNDDQMNQARENWKHAMKKTHPQRKSIKSTEPQIIDL